MKQDKNKFSTSLKAHVIEIAKIQSVFHAIQYLAGCSDLTLQEATKIVQEWISKPIINQ